MSSAQLEPRPEYDDDILGPDPTLFALQDPKALKEQVAARLAAHRARRQRKSPAPPAPTPITTPSRARTARIAATVAERYSHSESYRSFLAAEAESAIRQAEAAAHIAAVNALAVTAAQLDLLEELEPLPSTEPAQSQPTNAATKPGDKSGAPQPALSLSKGLASETWVTEPSTTHAPPNPHPTNNQQPTTSNQH